MQVFNSFQEVFNANAGIGLLSNIGVFNAPFDKYGVKGETVLDLLVGALSILISADVRVRFQPRRTQKEPAGDPSGSEEQSQKTSTTSRGLSD